MKVRLSNTKEVACRKGKQRERVCRDSGLRGMVVPWDEQGSENNIELPIFATHRFIRLRGDKPADEAEEDVQDDHDSRQRTAIAR